MLTTKRQVFDELLDLARAKDTADMISAENIGNLSIANRMEGVKASIQRSMDLLELQTGEKIRQQNEAGKVTILELPNGVLFLKKGWDKEDVDGPKYRVNMSQKELDKFYSSNIYEQAAILEVMLQRRRYRAHNTNRVH